MKSSAKDWNEVRGAFASSLMIETSLNSLAQNLDGPFAVVKHRPGAGVCPRFPQSPNSLILSDAVNVHVSAAAERQGFSGNGLAHVGLG